MKGVALGTALGAVLGGLFVAAIMLLLSWMLGTGFFIL